MELVRKELALDSCGILGNSSSFPDLRNLFCPAAEQGEAKEVRLVLGSQDSRSQAPLQLGGTGSSERRGQQKRATLSYSLPSPGQCQVGNTKAKVKKCEPGWPVWEHKDSHLTIWHVHSFTYPATADDHVAGPVMPTGDTALNETELGWASDLSRCPFRMSISYVQVANFQPRLLIPAPCSCRPWTQPVKPQVSGLLPHSLIGDSD